jgi:hypothetical protein
METKRNQRSQRSQTELSGTASAASGNLPWVRADKKSSVNARTRPLGMMSGELSVPDQSGTEASGSLADVSTEAPGWLHFSLETSDSSKGGWRRAAGGGPGRATRQDDARDPSGTRVGHSPIDIRRRIAASASGRRRRRARAAKKKRVRGCPAPNWRFRGKITRESRCVTFFSKTINCCPKKYHWPEHEREFHESAQIVIIAYV